MATDAWDTLPFIDVHSVVVDASVDDTWRGLVRVLASNGSNPLWLISAAVLGCAERSVRGAPDRVGSTIPGFHVARSEAPLVLRLEGRHRFSEYGLEFRISPLHHRRSEICAETRAAFPGTQGDVYRALVVGSHGHAIAMWRLLELLKRGAFRT